MFFLQDQSIGRLVGVRLGTSQGDQSAGLQADHGLSKRDLGTSVQVFLDNNDKNYIKSTCSEIWQAGYY